jgi:hypothetical protein
MPGAAAASEPCTPSSLSVSSSLNPVATAYKAGTWVQRPAAMTNTTGGELTDARFDFIIGPNSQKMGARPNARWSIDGGAWHYLSFFRTNIGMPVWRSDDNPLPAMADASKHTVRVSVSFPAGATEGSYFTQFNVGSASCGITWLGGTSNMNFGYLPSYAPKGTPAKSTPRPQASRATTATVHPSPPPSASASASPSASPSPAAPSETSTPAPPVLTPANRTSDTELPVAAAIALAAVLLLALVSPVLLRWWRMRGTTSPDPDSGE